MLRGNIGIFIGLQVYMECRPPCEISCSYTTPNKHIPLSIFSPSIFVRRKDGPPEATFAYRGGEGGGRGAGRTG